MTMATWDHALLLNDEMYRADAFAVENGVAGEQLMEAAGAGVAGAIIERWPPARAVVLCGPGNNGGDGYVAARHLKAAGFDVVLAALADAARLSGDAAAMAGRWDGGQVALEPAALEGADLIVDALFGAGLTRPLSGPAQKIVEAANQSPAKRVAVDIPSGVEGDTGAAPGTAFSADLTVTFFRAKPGHLLYPGRRLAGELVVKDIGIPEAALGAIAPAVCENASGLWRDQFPWPRPEQHKYHRGHAIVVGGDAASTGAGRLAALSALRSGAGLVTLVCPVDALAVNAAHLTAVMVQPCASVADFGAVLEDRRKNAVLVGPGNGIGESTREYALTALGTGLACVLDADALTVFGASPADLFRAIGGPCVLTPHEGEFKRLFGEADGGKLARARAAAAEAGAVVLLKGADTVIAAPDGRAVINANAPPELATAGSGDVLAGLVLGLLAQGMDAFAGACAAAWLHGAAASAFGPGLTADDLPGALPGVLGELKNVD